jgi:hypothetical protein
MLLIAGWWTGIVCKVVSGMEAIPRVAGVIKEANGISLVYR